MTRRLAIAPVYIHYTEGSSAWQKRKTTQIASLAVEVMAGGLHKLFPMLSRTP